MSVDNVYSQGDGPVPSRAEFVELASEADLVPVYREIPFDNETAVTAYSKLSGPPFGFLLESVVGGEKWARYSFLGTGAIGAWRLRSGDQEIWTPEGWKAAGTTDDPLGACLTAMPGERVATLPGLPRFWGGAVGYFGYDIVRFFERLPRVACGGLDVPDAVLLVSDVVVVVDNLFDRALVVAAARLDGGSPGAAYDEALERVDATIEKLRTRPSPEPLRLDAHAPELDWTSSYQRAEFERDVQRIRDYIHAGDAFQVVLSQRLTTELDAEPFRLYRALRMLNPSPYLFFLDLDGLQLIGSSPEVLVRVENERITVRPIAGTRPRGRTESEDLVLEAELRADEKELAEHLMLVDLGRNDVGRVARYGTVEVPEFMTVERYSQVEGELRAGFTPLDALRAAFPAGTVSGAPKIRAMEIIDELEPVRRGPYAGSVGYLSFDQKNLDMAIAIRTILVESGRAHVQAGAGIVADSVPSREYKETLEKARALLKALQVSQPRH